MTRLVMLISCLAAAPPISAITIELDYTYDASGFFGTAEAPTPARTTLEFAVRAFESFTDNLDAIQPGGGNSWTARIVHPATGGTLDIPNLAVSANTVRVFAGAHNLEGAQIGLAGPGIYASAPVGSPAFVNAVTNRGQGNSQFDFAPWGGFIAIDTLQSDGAPRQWHFDLGEPPPAGRYDFFTAVTHELAHMMGFGLSPAFDHDVEVEMVDEETKLRWFVGPTVLTLYQDRVPLTSNGQHWAANVTSPPYVGVQPEPSLSPFLSQAKRKTLTPLDYAALADLGWSVPSELIGLLGDIDDDNDVDGSDFLVWQRNLGGVGGAPGDVNGDLMVDDYDGWIVQRNLGAIGLAEGVTFAAALPEPSGPCLATVFIVAIVARRRSRK